MSNLTGPPNRFTLPPDQWRFQAPSDARTTAPPRASGIVSSFVLHAVVLLTIIHFGQHALKPDHLILPDDSRFKIFFEPIPPSAPPAAMPQQPSEPTKPTPTNQAMASLGYLPIESPPQGGFDAAGLPELPAPRPARTKAPQFMDAREFTSMPVQVMSVPAQGSGGSKVPTPANRSMPPTPHERGREKPSRKPTEPTVNQVRHDVHPPVSVPPPSPLPEKPPLTPPPSLQLAAVTPPRKPKTPPPSAKAPAADVPLTRSKPTPMMMVRLAAMRASPATTTFRQSKPPAGCRLVFRQVSFTPPAQPTNDLNGLISNVTANSQRLDGNMFGRIADVSSEQWQRDVLLTLPNIEDEQLDDPREIEVSQFNPGERSARDWWNNVGSRDSFKARQFRQAEWRAWQQYQRKMAGVSELNASTGPVQMAAYECGDEPPRRR